MTQVFLITEGEYSDYRIEAVFSTKELAEEYATKTHRSANRVIEVWDVDELKEAKDLLVFSVGIDSETGEIIFERAYSEFGTSAILQRKEISSRCCQGYSVESNDHAMKLAVEARQAYLRENTYGKS